jgi:effector-binding domain-containing protein
MTIHHGSYAGLGAVNAAIRAWCLANGRTYSGPSWEVYGHWHEDPAQLRTEVYYLLRP